MRRCPLLVPCMTSRRLSTRAPTILRCPGSPLVRTRFPVHVPSITILILSLLDAAPAADFPQWRGVDRTGVVKDSPPLADSWGRDGPRRAWESEVFPTNRGTEAR